MPSAAPTPVQRIYAAVRAIPRGRVSTYGELALLAEIPSGHRIAARAMRECPSGLPWYRVLGKKDARRAKIALADPEHAALQRRKLEAEGVRFDVNGYVSLRDFGWFSRSKRAGPRASNTQRPAKKRGNRAQTAASKAKNR